MTRRDAGRGRRRPVGRSGWAALAALPLCLRALAGRSGLAALGILLLTVCAGAGLPREARAESEAPDDLTSLTLEQLSEIEVVYAASGFSQKLTEAPSAVTIVSGEDVRRLGYRTLADVLADVRGVYVSSDRIYQYVGIRGFSRLGDYNGVFLVLVNGHAMNDHTFGYAGMGTDMALDLDEVERIEVARGPTSSIYGTAAFLGVVNVITHAPDERPGVEARMESGAFGERTAHVSAAGRLRQGVTGAMGVTLRHSDGPDLYFPEYDSPETNFGRAPGRNGDSVKQGFLQLAWDDLTLEARAVQRKKAIPTGIYDTVFNDPGTQTRDSRSYVDVGYAHTGRGGGRFVGHVAFDDDDYYGRYAYAGVDSGSVDVLTDFGHGQWLTLQSQYFGGTGGHALAVGGEFLRNLRVDQGDYYASSVIFANTFRFWSAALFAQDEFEVTARLRAHAALRLDHSSLFGNIVSPRESLIWTPARRDVVKVLHGMAFRAPNPYEVLFTSEEQKAPRSLAPEKMATYELVWDHELSPGISVLALAFAHDSRDLITLVQDPMDSLFVYENLDRMWSRGVEFEMRGRLPGGFHANLNYSYQRSEDPRTGQRIANSPAHLGVLSVVCPLFDRRLVAAASAQHTSGRLDREGGRVSGYTLVNTTLTLPRLAGHLELSASVYNLFNAHYADPAAVANRQLAFGQDARTAKLRLRLTP